MRNSSLTQRLAQNLFFSTLLASAAYGVAAQAQEFRVSYNEVGDKVKVIYDRDLDVWNIVWPTPIQSVLRLRASVVPSDKHCRYVEKRLGEYRAAPTPQLERILRSSVRQDSGFADMPLFKEPIGALKLLNFSPGAPVFQKEMKALAARLGASLNGVPQTAAEIKEAYLISWTQVKIALHFREGSLSPILGSEEFSQLLREQFSTQQTSLLETGVWEISSPYYDLACDLARGNVTMKIQLKISGRRVRAGRFILPAQQIAAVHREFVLNTETDTKLLQSFSENRSKRAFAYGLHYQRALSKVLGAEGNKLPWPVKENLFFGFVKFHSMKAIPASLVDSANLAENIGGRTDVSYSSDVSIDVSETKVE